MPNIIGVKFKEKGKVYYFDPDNIEFLENDGVVVETSRGVEYGTVAIANKEVGKEEVNHELKKVVRKATKADAEHHQKLLAKVPQAIKDAQAKINERKLDMKLVDVEFAFDDSKVTFMFSSEGRVDFRDLVKDLAGVFKSRIELRQIGIRDECKIKGGLGPCGRACCCNSYLEDFEHVSIKMAKNQGLSLNPTKISGLCGRLMCCLKFENDYYAETLKFMPKLGSEVVTKDGAKGFVDNTDILKQTARIKFISKDGATEYEVFKIADIEVVPCTKCKQENSTPKEKETAKTDKPAKSNETDKPKNNPKQKDNRKPKNNKKE